MDEEELQRRLLALESANQQLSQALGQATNEIVTLQTTQRFCAMLSALLKEPLDASIEQWERDIAVYASQSREKLPDHVRLALLQSNMVVPRIREHLSLSSSF
eukprot:2542544-Amphidinium_carterae.2